MNAYAGKRDQSTAAASVDTAWSRHV